MIILNVLKVILVLGFLIFIHEGGHCIVAKKCGVIVEEFAIGFGPKIFEKEKNGTLYSVRAVPLGGFCKMLGEEVREEKKGSFSEASPFRKALIVLAGPTVNIIFGIVLFFFLGVFASTLLSTTIAGKLPEYEANLTQLEIGDTILKINGENVKVKSDVDRIVRNLKDDNLILTVKRGEEVLDFNIKASKYKDYDIYVIGIEVEKMEPTIANRFYFGFYETANYLGSVADSVVKLVTGKIKTEQMMGPVGIGQMVVNTKAVEDLVYLISAISVSLGVTNLLPLPALDGGRLVLIIIEKIRGKALSEKTEYRIQTIGLTFLLLFSLYITYNDILRIF